MCAVPHLSPTTYYKYRNTVDRDYFDYLEIKRVFEEGKELYGARRIKKALVEDTGWIIVKVNIKMLEKLKIKM